MTKSPKIWTLLRLLQRRYLKKSAPAKVGEDKTNKQGIDRGKTLLMLFTIVALSAVMSIHLLPAKTSLHIGDVSTEEIRAGRSVVYYDSVQTARLQRANEANIPPIYTRDENANVEADRLTQDAFQRIEQLRNLYNLEKQHRSIAEFLKTTPPQLRSDIPEEQLKHLLTLSSPVFEKIRTTTRRLVSEAMEREIRDRNRNEQPANDLDIVRESVDASARNLFPTKIEAQIVGTISGTALRPNRTYNRAGTQLAREKAIKDTPAAFGRIAREAKIIGVSETVTQEHLDKFIALGLINPRIDIRTGTAICILAAAMVILVAFKIYRTLPSLWDDTRRLSLLSVIVLLSVFGLKLGATMLGVQFSSGQLGYLGMSSVAAASMLVCVLLDVHLAVLIAALLSVQSGLIMNHEIRFTVMTLMGSLVGISCVDTLRRQSNLPRIAFILSATNAGMVWLLGMLLNDSVQELLTGSGWAVGSAVFATFLFWTGITLLEKPFGILTHTTLLELSQFDNPLLQQLCAVAPGTYAHSIMVGTLSEAGANAIGANGLLCRVGGYYHDVGKMKRPDFFVENQRKENVHGRLSPSLSALIITAHVRDGLELAKQHRLPKEIRDIIAEHHGTTLIRYFYHQALMDCGGADEAPPGLEERFRYPGPRPQSRESAVVMLADTVEAATRTLDKPSPERLEAMIHSLVHDKLDDGQMDACDLTFKDIKSIMDAFMHVLRAMMHERIDYPQLPKNATGSPMEVVRDDLRPESVGLILPTLTAEKSVVHFHDHGASVSTNPTDETDSEEVLYAHTRAERPDATRQDDRSAPSSTAPLA